MEATMSGATALAGSDAGMMAILRDEVFAEARAARHDINRFFEFVMREETTRQPVRVLPHQRVVLEFAMAHDRSVIFMPIGSSKTFSMAALTLFLMGQNPTLRGAVVSATSAQAEKVVSMVRDYIEQSPRLRHVFPHMVKSSRKGDAWTQRELIIQRPAGIRDASLIAHGIDSGSIQGSRLSWVIVDDILNMENTSSKAQRDKTAAWVDSSVLSRIDPAGKVVVTNTAWHPDDLPHRLERHGWASLRIDVMGNILVKDDADAMLEGKEPWDSTSLRPRTNNPHDPYCRLAAYDPDPSEALSLWPAKFTNEYIAKMRREHLPAQFNQLFMNVCRDDATARCKLEWIEACKAKAREMGISSLVSSYSGPNATFTGVDLAISPGENHDDTALVTFEARPDGMKVLLDVDVGQFHGPEIVNKLFEKQRQYNSVVRVESNAAQEYIVQFARQRDISFPIRSHVTGRGKAHPEHGVEGFFLELYNGAWAIPNRGGHCHPMVQKLIDACLYYNPERHTDDVLMAMYFAREQAREWGLLTPHNAASGPQNIGMAIMSR